MARRRVTSSAGTAGGFTIVEVLLVVVILSILALVVIPRVMDASEEARDAALLDMTKTLQEAIERYRFDHNRRGPHQSVTGAVDVTNLMARLTKRTDASGAINPTKGKCGPYLKSWPANPFSDPAVASKWISGPLTSAPRDDKAGWYFSTSKEAFFPNSSKGCLDEYPPAKTASLDSMTNSGTPK